MTIMALWEQAGGFIYPIALMGLIGVLLFIERFVFLHKGQIRAEPFLNGIENLLQKGRRMEALTLSENTPGPVASLTKIALLNYNLPAKDLREVLRKQALLELPALRKHIDSLRVIAQLYPLLGLIGTVFALLKGFWCIGSLDAYTSITSFSPYIVSACTLTFMGLVGSFLAYLAYHFLMGRLRSIIFDLEITAQRFLEQSNKAS